MSAIASDALIEAYARVGEANRRAFAALAVVLSRFRDRRIDVLLLKGADVLPRLYGVWGARSLTDVDMLVREADLQAVDDVLRALGYAPVIDGNPAYQAPDRSLWLDLVTRIWYAADTEEIWRRSVRRDVGEFPVRAMGAEDLLLYLTAYSVLHRGHFQPSYAQDLSLLVRRERLDWAFILDEARRANLRIPLAHGLAWGARHASVPIPDHVLRSLEPSSRAERVWRVVLRRLVTDEAMDGVGHFLLLASQPRGRRWSWLRRALWPSRAFLAWRYGDGGGCRGRRVRRVARLALQGLGLSRAIIFRLLRPAPRSRPAARASRTGGEAPGEACVHQVEALDRRERAEPRAQALDEVARIAGR